MCGIVGYVGLRACTPMLLNGLSRLEYRGYDSAGIALHESDGIRRVRAVGPLANLRSALGRDLSPASSGLGHTRWATHGGVTEANAHPLGGCVDGELTLVLNGIVENHGPLRAELAADGHRFRSETDAEVVAHLVERCYSGGLAAAVREASGVLEGHYAFVVMHRDHPAQLVATRHACPLVVGLGEDEVFVASNPAAFAGETRLVQFPEDGDIVTLTLGRAEAVGPDGAPAERERVLLDWDEESAGKGEHDTFMLKEIHEQPESFAATVRGAAAELDSAGLDGIGLADVRRVMILSAGTSYHAGLVVRHALEEWAGLEVTVDIASEWLYRRGRIDPETLVIGISQSGETRDTLSALQLARDAGARVVAVTNTADSQITREADAVLLTRAGLEVSVAASKTFTAQLALLFLLAIRFAEARGAIEPARAAELRAEIEALPAKIRHFLAHDHPIDEIAARHFDRPFFLFLGRHAGLPVALEGALKLKEVAYAPSDAYAAGEMKHGPIALLDEGTPVVVVATDSHVYGK
ncbi:MAG TPA: glutamine--fructose-6-phosphate transaminase (isomerizing), partial [Gaiellaceae bacterium]|nr:glutamine--fructose-6-phosphate transaminase (isomerizing) [Gaiellaceae bacterium]